jgi:hypothetical protein
MNGQRFWRKARSLATKKRENFCGDLRWLSFYGAN